MPVDGIGVGDEALDLLTYGEAATRLRVSMSTIRRLIASRDLEKVNVGRAVRTTPESVAAYKQKLKNEAAQKNPAA